MNEIKIIYINKTILILVALLNFSNSCSSLKLIGREWLRRRHEDQNVAGSQPTSPQG